MKFVLASSNAHKAAEIRSLLQGNFELMLQSELAVPPADETGSTFIENALIKARHATEITGLPAISDDSGICVDALGGNPGVRSARYAGESATDDDNVAKLLSALAGENQRNARFHCVLVCLAHATDPAPIIAEASWTGEIARERTGVSGFGYDPVFYLPELGKTAAELNMAEKNAISHRGKALTILARQLSDRYPA